MALRSNPPAAQNTPKLVYEVGNGRQQGSGIIAGLLNDYNFFEALGNTYVFADSSGKVLTIPFAGLVANGIRRGDEIENRTEDFAPDVGAIDSPQAFSIGFGSSHFYILDADGEIFRVEAAS